MTHLEELARASEDSPDKTWVVMHDVPYSYREAWDAVRAVAEGLRGAGVSAGDRVVILLPNRIEALWAWLGANLVGAIDAPLSIEARGALLDYYLNDLEPTLVIAAPDLAVRMSEGSGFRPETLVLHEGEVGSRPLGGNVRTLSWDELMAPAAGGAEQLPPPPAEATATIIYTSGTTGPSKGVMLSQGYWGQLPHSHTPEVPAFHPSDVVYCAQPLCHMDARSVVLDCLLVRCTFVLAETFSASRYWDDVERYDADKFVYIGSMLHLVFKQPDRQSGRTTRHRCGIGAATPPAIYDAFRERFDCDLVEGYGMTEVPFMAHQHPDHVVPGTVGHLVGIIEGRLLDDYGQAFYGEGVGELVVRPNVSHVMMQGYWRKPEATLAALHDLWFHTGDLLRRLPSGDLQYVGRRKDSIRRRGENVSAWEVEQAALKYPQVREAAAIGVPSDLGDEDVALLVVPTDPLDPPDLLGLRAAMSADLPRFALPRYLEVVPALPKTPSERVAKGQVRERGVTSAAYDAEADESAGGTRIEKR